MDHETAVRTRVAERYVLGELPPAERDWFEGHYFDCVDCADDVRSGMVFAANTRAVCRERQQGRAVPGESYGRWIRFFSRPAFALAFAAVSVALVVGIALYSLKLRRQLQLASVVQVPSFVTIKPLASAPDTRIKVSQTAGLLVLRLVLPPQRYAAYSYELVHDSGKSRLGGSIPGPSEEAEDIFLAIPTSKLQAGRYRMTLNGLVNGRPVQISEQPLEVEPG